MRYYLIAGEASGDLHASRLISALKNEDAEAEFRGFGGDLMAKAGCTLARHYRELAFMGIGPVLTHLPQILGGMRQARRDILQWQPQAVILVDYPGFNMRMAKYVKTHTDIPVYYYIAPKIWAWKEWRIRSIKRYVDELFSILPFEVEFFEGKHHYPIHYVGNPTADEVREFLSDQGNVAAGTDPRPVIALLPGSRRQEIKDNLPAMLQAVSPYASTHRVVIAGAPSMPESFYRQLAPQGELCFGQTYRLLHQACAALVTSGTATLETALLGTPQVVCYATPLPRLVALVRRWVLKVQWVSLVNLIAGREVVRELVADTFSVANIQHELAPLLSSESEERQLMLRGYEEVWQRLGNRTSPVEAARLMTGLLRQTKA